MRDMRAMLRMLKEGRAAEAHGELDHVLKTATEDQKISVAHRRTALLIHSRRYYEALNHLYIHRDNYGCSTLARHERAMIFDLLGRDAAVLSELDLAPYDAEYDRFPMLVDDALFYRAFFKLQKGISIEPSELDRFPTEYASHVPFDGECRGREIFRSDLIKMMTETYRST